ncbi:MAG: Hsp20 family protein [Candidatus Lokiarchaeota archaeon]|nr:Hsp20 family protein [Candidatus Lokiarchaeota archaeon]MBD3200538.1 Hsp20 family protein [Candidatus Lokiarchaeota archaeon]
MPKDDDYDKDEEDKDEFRPPFDIFELFKDPNKFMQSDQFQKMFQDLFSKIMKNLPENLKDLSPEELQREFMKNKSKFGWKGPFMTGFNINFDSQGKPTFEQFGNIKKEPKGKAKVDEYRDPLIEINEEQDKFIVIAEMPGANKEDIELKATSNTLTISTKEKTPSGLKYYKEVELPFAINSDVAKARYVNGILEVKLKKQDEKQSNIKID